MEPESNTGLAIFIALLIFVGGIGGAFYYFFYREGKSPFERSVLKKVSATNEGSGGGQRIPGDVNDNGTIDNTDVQIVRDHIGCESTQDCWGDVIGKTLSGDNPIYTSDLDLEKNNKVDESDAQFVLDKFSH